MRSFRLMVAIAALAGGVTACSHNDADSEERDLGLMLGDSTVELADTAEVEAAAAPVAAAPTPAPRPRRRPPTLAAGTGLVLYAADTLTSRHNKASESIMAVLAEAVTAPDGREVIPAGAIFTGVITDIAPAESPGGEGRIALQFTHVEINGEMRAFEGAVDSLMAYTKGRGVTAGDAAKVGAGAVVGGVAGRVIGGNARGTIIGAAAGAAAGVGIAAATRDVDIIIDAGAPIFLTLTADLVR